MTNTTEFIKDWCEFGDERVYMLWGIARRAHNPALTYPEEPIHRRVIRSEDDIEYNYETIKSWINRYDKNFRIYLSVNARNTIKAQRKLSSDMDSWMTQLVYGNDEIKPKFKKISSEWKSILQNPEVCDDDYFLIDYDGITDEQRAEITASLSEETSYIHYVRETPNGWHFITDPFNYTEWDAPLAWDALITDGAVFIEEINNGS